MLANKGLSVGDYGLHFSDAKPCVRRFKPKDIGVVKQRLFPRIVQESNSVPERMHPIQAVSNVKTSLPNPPEQ